MRLEKISPAPTLTDAAAASILFAGAFDGLEHEELRVAHLDSGLRLLRLSGGGSEEGVSKDRISLRLRPLIHEALMLGARAIILAHNHPQGCPKPSAADISATRRLAAIARPLEITLVDHLIFAGRQVTSFRALGLL